MGFDSLPCGGELAVMHERSALVIESPKLTCDELAISGKEPWRTGRLILIQRFTVRVARTCSYVMNFQVGVGRHHDNPAMCTEAGQRQYMRGTLTISKSPWFCA